MVSSFSTRRVLVLRDLFRARLVLGSAPRPNALLRIHLSVALVVLPHKGSSNVSCPCLRWRGLAFELTTVGAMTCGQIGAERWRRKNQVMTVNKVTSRCMVVVHFCVRRSRRIRILDLMRSSDEVEEVSSVISLHVALRGMWRRWCLRCSRCF